MSKRSGGGETGKRGADRWSISRSAEGDSVAGSSPAPRPILADPYLTRQARRAQERQTEMSDMIEFVRVAASAICPSSLRKTLAVYQAGQLDAYCVEVRYSDQVWCWTRAGSEYVFPPTWDDIGRWFDDHARRVRGYTR